MTRRHRTKAPAKLLRSLYIWHRYIGLVSAAFVIVLAVTGLLLNHTEEAGLDSMHVSSPALLDWYGIQAPDEIRAFDTGDLTVAELDGQWFAGDARLPAVTGKLAGAVSFKGMVIAVSADQLVLLMPDGSLVERMVNPAGAGSAIQAIGIDAAGLPVIRTTGGDFQADADLVQWHAVTATENSWASPATLGSADRQALELAWRGKGLSMERVMLDLHSGRILGSWGVYLMDAAAILFLVLAFSGVWLWLKRRASARAHQRKISRRGPHQST